MLNPFSVTSHCSYADRIQGILGLKAVKCTLCLLQGSAVSLAPGLCWSPCADEERAARSPQRLRPDLPAPWQLLPSLCSPLGTGHWALGTGHWALGTGHMLLPVPAGTFHTGTARVSSRSAASQHKFFISLLT